MTKREASRKPKHDYLIELLGRTIERRIYSVKISGEANRHFFVEITGTQNVRPGVTGDIETWCRQHDDKLPENGKRIFVNLDEVEKL